MDENKKQILIIEDDMALQTIYQQKFTQEGFIVSQATTGSQGLSMAKETKPDMVLLDIMLPGGMNGFDVMEEIRRDQNLKDLPVIMITNLDSEKQVAMEMGAKDYVVKANTSVDEMVEKVKANLVHS